MKRKFFGTIILTVCLAFVTGLFAGCDFGAYRGKHADLYTVAINSVLWNCGWAMGADHPINSHIEIIERDEFGRTLYEYRESFYYFRTISFSALLVSQYTSDGQVYYYEDCNYIVKEQALFQVPNKFESEEIEQLKEVNDWDKPIDTDKCIGKTIAKKKQKNADIESAVINSVLNEYEETERRHRTFADYLTDDKNGNCIYYGVIAQLSREEDIFFVAFVSAEGDIKLFTPSNLFDYNEELKTFKAENGWVS